MFLLPFLGFWLRFVFVFRLNWKNMENIRDKNKNIQKRKDVKAGAMGFILILLILIFYQIIAGKIAFL
ncbi:hypothetical protein [Sinomicrobium sp. M5D2P17]